MGDNHLWNLFWFLLWHFIAQLNHGYFPRVGLDNHTFEILKIKDNSSWLLLHTMMETICTHQCVSCLKSRAFKNGSKSSEWAPVFILYIPIFCPTDHMIYVTLMFKGCPRSKRNIIVATCNDFPMLAINICIWTWIRKWEPAICCWKSWRKRSAVMLSTEMPISYGGQLLSHDPCEQK